MQDELGTDISCVYDCIT